MTAPAMACRELSRCFPTVAERGYVRGKLATDPLYPAVLAALRDTRMPLLDIGCGMGVLAFYLRIHGWDGDIRGIDYDERKIATANRLAPKFGGALDFSHGDAAAGLPAHSGNVTILDILQYFSPEARQQLLAESARRVAPGGRLIIRTGLVADNWRFRVTRLMDHVANALGWMKDAPGKYPVAEEMTAWLEREGLAGEFQPLWGRTPFNNWLGVFSRQAAG